MEEQTPPQDARSGRRVLRWLSAHRTALIVAACVVAAFVLGYLIGGARPGEHDHPAPSVAPSSEEGRAAVWTCAMHPYIRESQPGRCPVCGMVLIRVAPGAGKYAPGRRELELSEAARKLADIRTARVERRYVGVEVRMVGTVEYDETRLSTIAAWVSGRIDRLMVDYTGVAVRRGDGMASIYSPELFVAQEELLQALRAARAIEASAPAGILLETTSSARAAGSSAADWRIRAAATVEAARAKLRLAGLEADQIEEVERRGSASDHVTIRSPATGVVVERHASEGDYVRTGSPLFAVADLSRVWVLLDAYESDIHWIRDGQEVEFTTEAYPGETFTGRVVFVQPVLDRRTRSVKVRVEAPNDDGRLKPGMFARALLRARATAHGRPDEPPLVIPATAPLITGRRAVVYVAVPGKEGVFEGREIVLGPRAGDHYVVREGLEEGDEVVTKGGFKIDSELQILARPSMMSPGDAGRGAAGSRRAGMPAGVAEAIRPIYAAYFELHEALAADDLAGARTSAGTLVLELAKELDAGLDAAALREWRDGRDTARAAAAALAESEDIEAARGEFLTISNWMVRLARELPTPPGRTVYLQYCPMAFGKRGASWLSREEKILNPYFGAAMLSCGEVRETFVPEKGPE